MPVQVLPLIPPLLPWSSGNENTSEGSGAADKLSVLAKSLNGFKAQLDGGY